GQADHRRENHAEEDREHLAHVGGEQVAQELADVLEDLPPFPYGANDGGEVVVGENHVRRFLGDLGASDAHGDSDVGRLQRWRVVDAIACHRHDFAVGLKCVDDPQLVCRRDSGVDRALPYRLLKLLVVHPVQLGTGDCDGIMRDAEFLGDRRGGARVVARDHYDPDAGAAGLFDGGRRLWPRRVDDPHHPGVDEVALQLFVDLRWRALVKFTVGDGEGAKALAGKAFDIGEDLLPAGIVEGYYLVTDLHL